MVNRWRSSVRRIRAERDAAQPVRCARCGAEVAGRSVATPEGRAHADGRVCRAFTARAVHRYRQLLETLGDISP